MKRIVADLIGSQMNYGGSVNIEENLRQQTKMREKLESGMQPHTERVFTVSLVVNANEAEILEDKVVIEKRVIAFDRQGALDKCGFVVKE